LGLSSDRDAADGCFHNPFLSNPVHPRCQPSDAAQKAETALHGTATTRHAFEKRGPERLCVSEGEGRASCALSPRRDDDGAEEAEGKGGLKEEVLLVASPRLCACCSRRLLLLFCSLFFSFSSSSFVFSVFSLLVSLLAGFVVVLLLRCLAAGERCFGARGGGEGRSGDVCVRFWKAFAAV